jgi:hypothetical protein
MPAPVSARLFLRSFRHNPPLLAEGIFEVSDKFILKSHQAKNSTSSGTLVFEIKSEFGREYNYVGPKKSACTAAAFWK